MLVSLSARIFFLVFLLAVSLAARQSETSNVQDLNVVRRYVEVEHRTYGDAQRYRCSAHRQLRRAIARRDLDELKLVAIRFELTGDALLAAAASLTREANDLVVASERAFADGTISSKRYRACQRYARHVLSGIEDTWVIKPENEAIASIVENVR